LAWFETEPERDIATPMGRFDHLWGHRLKNLVGFQTEPTKSAHLWYQIAVSTSQMQFRLLTTSENVLKMIISIFNDVISTSAPKHGSTIFTIKKSTFDFHSPFGILKI